MSFTTEVKDRNRIQIPPSVVRLLSLKRGDFIEVKINLAKMEMTTK
jgi:bifunctional DNA-binding transcriptional regulator/antitoxin component of YhaV-PrlF toxin-antitoxin module